MFTLVLDEAERVGAKRVSKIDLVIGEMTGALSECVQFDFNLLSKGTVGWARQSLCSYCIFVIYFHNKREGENIWVNLH